ncbi:glutamine--fructose-6-phosphate transaminase (isomerizing) [Candidatus Nomurabacteria bacterium]|nr:glutamine--fructose-6-phosphate transaminase (isomerizing) [Candidatus Nomurabacteria bacterium]
MCGIIGYAGFKPATDILIPGLEKLEPRGYDSCGVVFIGEKDARLLRVVGGASVLKQYISQEHHKYTCGIGHTRWATHGDATQENAHPHSSGDIWVVHNGQIDNYKEIKSFLVEHSYKFSSETDTEVIPHLIHYYRSTGLDIRQSIIEVVNKLKGAFALAIGVTGEDIIYAVTQTSPLIIGYADHGNFVASTPDAFPSEVTQYAEVSERTLVVVHPDKVSLYGIKDQKEEVPTKLPLDREVIDSLDKNGYEHWMLKEIMEQPETLDATMRGRVQGRRITLGGLEYGNRKAIQQLIDAEQVIFLACGTSYYAACVGAYLFEKYLGIRSRAEIGSEFASKQPLITTRDVVVGISQSGETADTIAGLKYARSKGALILGICNTAGSSMVRMNEGGTLLHAGPERSVASTKAFTSQVTTLYMWTALLAQKTDKKIDWLPALEFVPRSIIDILAIDQTKHAAQYLATQQKVFVIGRELDFAVAQETALKIKEVSYVHAEAFAAGEMKHGTFALLEEGVPCIVFLANLSEELRDKMLNQLQQIKSRGAYTIVVCNEKDDEVIKQADRAITMKYTHPDLRVIPHAIVGQLLAYNTALILGRDIDRPRNLAKAVTVE